MPMLGMSVPIMGKKRSVRSNPSPGPRSGGRKTGVALNARKPSPESRRGGLANALFTKTQQRVLGLLFGQPERNFYASELIALAGGGSGAVQRELSRLEGAGLVTTRRLGNQKHYQANPESPLFSELCGIVKKTVGLAEPLREALGPVAPQIRAAFVYGSVAKRQDSAASDIDLMLISDTLNYADTFSALETASTRLGRRVNPTIFSRSDLEQRIREDNAFVTRVVSQAKIWLIGSEDDLRV